MSEIQNEYILQNGSLYKFDNDKNAYMHKAKVPPYLKSCKAAVDWLEYEEQQEKIDFENSTKKGAKK